MQSRDDPKRYLDLLQDADTAYSVVVVEGTGEKTLRTGLSHAAAMALAEELQRHGKIARVMHDTGGGSYEVDRYPLR